MYNYPEYNPQSIGGFMNPRDYGNRMGSPVVPSIPSITATGYGTPSSVSDFVTQQAMYGGPQDRSLNFSQNGLNDALGITDQNPLGNNPNLSALDKLKNGWGQMNLGQQAGAVLGGVGSLYGMYNARKTGKLAKDQFNFTKDAFNRNFAAQANITNSQLADRQNARHTRDPKAHSSVADYMKKYGV